MGVHSGNYLDLLSRKTSHQKRKTSGPWSKEEKLENFEIGHPCDKLTRSVEDWTRFRNKRARGKMEFERGGACWENKS